MSRSGWIRVRSLFGSGQLWVKYVRVEYGSDFSEVRVLIYFGSIMFGLGTGSVQLTSGSGLFRVA